MPVHNELACRVVARSITERFKRQPVFAHAPTWQSSLYAIAPSEDWRRGDSGLRPSTQICRANFHRGAAPLASLACARSCHPNDLGKFFSQTLLGFESPHQGSKPNGGGGIRTPVPRCFKTSVYMLSRFIVFSPH